jgi:hypothetical protein
VNLQKAKAEFELPFEIRALSALGLSVAADALDYLAAPIFAMPVIGDIADSIITASLYSITRSKMATAINTIEFIPVIGDLLPVYTLSTLLWICQQLLKGKKYGNNQNPILLRKSAMNEYNSGDRQIKGMIAKRYANWKRTQRKKD